MCAQTKTRSSTFVTPSSPNRFEQRVRDRRRALRPLVQPERDPRGVPEEQRRDDPRDQREDQVRLAEMAALEARRALDLADDHRADHAGEHQHREQVDHEREPALVAEPRERGVAVDRADHRDHDRGEEDEEAPEDRRVDQPGHEPLEQLPLARARSRPRSRRAWARRRSGPPACRASRASTSSFARLAEQRAADGEQRGERERSGRDVYEDCAFLSSAVIAGTTSARSPITA